MVMRVQRRGDEYGVVFSREVLEALRLTDGAEVEVRAVGAERSGAQPATEHRYATVEEGLEAFRATLPQHREAYRELAK
jgi:antitoxin component of MazEF toxin-antitoxin module